MFLDSNHVLKVYFKPSRKNQDFLFLPLSSVPVWLKIRYLSPLGKIQIFLFLPLPSEIVWLKIRYLSNNLMDSTNLNQATLPKTKQSGCRHNSQERGRWEIRSPRAKLTTWRQILICHSEQMGLLACFFLCEHNQFIYTTV